MVCFAGVVTSSFNSGINVNATTTTQQALPAVPYHPAPRPLEQLYNTLKFQTHTRRNQSLRMR